MKMDNKKLSHDMKKFRYLANLSLKEYWEEYHRLMDEHLNCRCMVAPIPKDQGK